MFGSSTDDDQAIIEQAQRIVDSIEQAAEEQKAELVLDQLDELVALNQEFPETVWDACVRLTRSREPAVRVAMAVHGIPIVHNGIGRAEAAHLTRWLLTDPDPHVVEAMHASLKNCP